MRGKARFRSVFVGLVLLMGSLSGTAQAATAPIPSDFNLQVSPSPLVTTIKPGTKSSIELHIHNSGSGTENLQVQPRAFRYDSKTGNVTLEDGVPPIISNWMTFSSSRFSVLSDQTFTQTVNFNVPKDAGFSYSFALVISRQAQPKPRGSEQIIAGSLAVFTLVNVDRPGAKSELQVVSFTSAKKLYEYLPATLSVRFRNSGNTIVQPSGNIFVQRTAHTPKPTATLPVNEKQGYILPGTERTVNAQWKEGFAVYQTTADSGKTAQHLSVDWGKLKQFRIGRYTAKLVAVYSDGHHDVPIEGVVTFWVIPWKAILLALLLIVALYLFFRWRGKRRTEKAVKRALAARDAADKAKAPQSAEKIQEKRP
jgi:hypothetical protein